MSRQRYIIAVGLCAIVAPLLINLYVQYKSLTELQEVAPVARRASLERRLEAVGGTIFDAYRQRASEVLTVSPKVLLPKETEDNVEAAFASSPADGVKHYFVSSLDPDGRVKVTLFDPAERKRIKKHPKTNKFTPEQSREAWSALFAASPFLGRAHHNTVVDPQAVVSSDEDPDNPVVVRPIVDAGSRAVGVAGMVLDRDYFRTRYVPTVLNAALRGQFSDAELEALAVTVYDAKGNVVHSEGRAPAAPADAEVPVQFAFSDWRIVAHTVGPTHEAIAQRNFALNFSVTVLNTVILIVVVAFALRTANRAMKISQMKADFVSNVSHELRTPLASIRVLGEFLRTGRAVEPEKLRKYGEYIDTESRRLTQLINNILDFSKIESGKREYDFARVDLTDLVMDALGSFEVRASQAGFEIEFDLLDAGLPSVSADAGAMEQVVSNLLDNALKYSGESRRITVQVGREGGDAVVSVTDYGVGIPRDELSRVFERFHRVSTGLVHNVKGSGLGLSLVKHIVEAHGGRVTVASEVGKGSTFTIYIPLERAAGLRAEGAAGRAAEAGSLGAG